jgi:hypothetical protein
MRMAWLARYLQVNPRLISDAIKEGYMIKYPRIRMTTPEHFLKWCEIDPEADTPEDVARREEVLAQITTRAAASRARRQPPAR